MVVASRCRCVSSVSPLSESARSLKSMPLKRPRPRKRDGMFVSAAAGLRLRHDDVHVGFRGIADVFDDIDFFADEIAVAVIAIEIDLQPAVRVLSERRPDGNTHTSTHASTNRNAIRHSSPDSHATVARSATAGLAFIPGSDEAAVKWPMRNPSSWLHVVGLQFDFTPCCCWCFRCSLQLASAAQTAVVRTFEDDKIGAPPVGVCHGCRPRCRLRIDGPSDRKAKGGSSCIRAVRRRRTVSRLRFSRPRNIRTSSCRFG